MDAAGVGAERGCGMDAADVGADCGMDAAGGNSMAGTDAADTSNDGGRHAAPVDAGPMSFDEALLHIRNNLFTISGMAFMDATNLDAERLRRIILGKNKSIEGEAKNNTWLENYKIVRGNPVRVYEGLDFKRRR